MDGPHISVVKAVSVPLLAIIAVLAVSACGGEGETELAVAQARVEERDQALADAQEAAASATEEFCTRAESYVVGLDRYADVLGDSAPTVGDVRDAGSELKAPQEAVVNSAEDAVAARNAVTDAEQALVQAQRELAALTAGTPGAAVSEAPTGTASGLVPKVPSATMNRVQQAEADFDTAVDSVSDQTLLVDASQQINAAAVALELSWLQLLADVDCLTKDEQKQAAAAVRDYTLALQKSLKQAGYYKGEVDGIYGPQTVEAVETLQKEHDLPVTGTVDKATAQALQSELATLGGEAEKEAIATTAAVQQTLKLAGYWTGAVDGVWTDELTAAIESLQADLDVQQTGELDAKTVAAMEEAIETARQPEPEPTEKQAKPSATE